MAGEKERNHDNLAHSLFSQCFNSFIEETIGLFTCNKCQTRQIVVTKCGVNIPYFLVAHKPAVRGNDEETGFALLGRCSDRKEHNAHAQ